MRISDWSSDVFSSDLHILDNSCARAVIVSTAKLARTLMPAVMRSDAHIVITMESLRVGQQGEVSVHDWAPLVEGGEAYLEEIKARGLGVKREEIGRASCRERVCRYV